MLDYVTIQFFCIKSYLQRNWNVSGVLHTIDVLCSSLFRIRVHQWCINGTAHFSAPKCNTRQQSNESAGYDLGLGTLVVTDEVACATNVCAEKSEI